MTDDPAAIEARSKARHPSNQGWPRPEDEDDPSLVGVAADCLAWFVLRDQSNALIHRQPVRYSPLTVEMAEALRGWYHDGRPMADDPLVREVLAWATS